MANGVLTIVFEKFEETLDPVIAAAVNELRNLGHTIKEVRVADDSGETKVALNTVAGVTPLSGASVAPPPPGELVTSTPVTPVTAPEVEGAPVDTPPSQAPVVGEAAVPPPTATA